MMTDSEILDWLEANMESIVHLTTAGWFMVYWEDDRYKGSGGEEALTIRDCVEKANDAE